MTGKGCHGLAEVSAGLKPVAVLVRENLYFIFATQLGCAPYKPPVPSSILMADARASALLPGIA